MTSNSSASSFFLRHEFLIRRLHSLSGLVPVGAYMCVHLLTNASLLAGVDTFQSNVNMIHSIPFLPLIEWLFIFGPILFHAIVGIWIARTGRSNSSQYAYTANRRYSLQRMTGYIAIIFIFTHVFHLHGWFHTDWWIQSVAEPLGMAQFKPYNAGSTLAEAMTSFGGIVWPVFYLLGVLACTYHLANGIWTAGITWGLWLTPKAQSRATAFCTLFGIFIGAAGIASIVGAVKTDPVAAKEIEDRMYEARIEAGAKPNEHKRSQAHGESHGESQGDAQGQQPSPEQTSDDAK